MQNSRLKYIFPEKMPSPYPHYSRIITLIHCDTMIYVDMRAISIITLPKKTPA